MANVRSVLLERDIGFQNNVDGVLKAMETSTSLRKQLWERMQDAKGSFDDRAGQESLRLAYRAQRNLREKKAMEEEQERKKIDNVVLHVA